MAIGKIKNEFAWKYANLDVTGPIEINISGLNFKELLVQVDVNQSGNKELFYIPKAILSSSNAWFRLGGYGANATDAGLITVFATLTTVKLVTCYLNGADYKNNTKVQIYYR